MVTVAFEGTNTLSIDGVFDLREGRPLPDNGTIMDLSAIRESVKLSDDIDDELFIPERVVVRGEMEMAFQELLQRSYPLLIFSGSAGIGKSVLLFLVVLYRVWKNDAKAIYFRMIDDGEELGSALALQKLCNRSVEVHFARNLRRSNTPLDTYYNPLREALEHMDGAPRRTSSKLVAAVDGPTSEELIKYSKLTYGCTSGPGFRIKHQNMNSVDNVVMSAWTKDSIESSVISLLDLDAEEENDNSDHFFDRDLLDEINYVNGGRIRGFVEGYLAGIPQQKQFVDRTIARISKAQ